MVGIVVREEKELNAIINDIEENAVYEKTFYKGLIENKKTVPVKRTDIFIYSINCLNF